jgi:hypothetical protein
MRSLLFAMCWIPLAIAARQLSGPDQDKAAIRSSARVTIATFWIA